MIPEIIEIGAVKIDTAEQGIELDTFQKYIFPEIQQRISDRTLSFIGLKKEGMPEFIPFREAFRLFIEWLDPDSDYALCTWSSDDKRLIIEHCARFGVELGWLKNYNDIQPAISHLIAGRKQVSLKDAIDAAGIIQEGRLHSALVDAIHTAQLLIRFNKNLQLVKNTPQENYALSSPLYITCKICSKTKYYKAFGRKSNKCKRCLQQKMMSKKTGDTSV